MNDDYKKNGFVVVRNRFSQDVLNLINLQLRILRDGCYTLTENKNKFEDDQVKNSFTWYSPLCCEALLVSLQKDYEEILDKSLYPCYSYMRIMYGGAEMKKHKDRESCQYSATICLYEDIPYPIFIEDRKGNKHEVHLDPGDLLFYRGTQLNHWREVYTGKEHIQTFVHYVDVNGPFSDFKYDKRKYLGLPKQERNK